MSIVTIDNFHELRPNYTRILGLDHGTKRIGVAVATPERDMAMPVCTIENKTLDAALKDLADIMKDRDTAFLVIGLPLNMDGTEGSRAQSVRSFAENILKHKELFHAEPIITFSDERLSSHAAEHMLIDDLNMRRDKRKDVIDQIAAVEILKGFLAR